MGHGRTLETHLISAQNAEAALQGSRRSSHEVTVILLRKILRI